MKNRASRRLLISAAVFAVLLGACSLSIPNATPSPVPRVGLMHVGIDHVPPSLDALVGRLAELGWLEGSQEALVATLVGEPRNATLHGQIDSPRMVLMWRNLKPEEVGEQANVFAREQIDVIVAFEDKSISAAQAVTAGSEAPIPVVFLHPSDPVRDGLVESLSDPGGNLTGVFGARDPVARQLELYVEIMPDVHRLLTLVDPTDSTATPPLLPQALDAAQQLGLELDMREASNEGDLEDIFQSLAPGEVDGAFLLSPSLRLNFSKLTIELATAAGLPIQAHRKEWVEGNPQVLDQGALFSLGVDVAPVGAAGARFVDSILNGTVPADLPVEEVPRVEFAISLKRAAELDIDVSQDVQDRADVVYR